MTGMIGRQRVKKNSLRMEAIGTVDELVAQIGLVVTHVQHPGLYQEMVRIQSALMYLGAALAGGESDPSVFDTKKLESQIDVAQEVTGPIKNFILPGGHPVAAQLHVARSICRRLERRILDVGDWQYIPWINRLSDLMFALARLANYLAKGRDVTWPPTTETEDDQE